MLDLFTKPPLRLDVQPSMGPPLLAVTYEPIGALPAAPPVTPPDPVVVLLTAQLRELRALRQDLADRTWAARWRRWVRALSTFFTRMR